MHNNVKFVLMIIVNHVWLIKVVGIWWCVKVVIEFKKRLKGIIKLSSVPFVDNREFIISMFNLSYNDYNIYSVMNSLYISFYNI